MAEGSVLAVVGGSGGVGASSFAAVVAAVAAVEQPTTLVDLDPVGGGVDVLLGIEDVAGARWSGLRVDGGYLDPDLLLDGLPRWEDVAVLAADVPPPSAAAIEQVVAAAARNGPVVLDLPRAPSAERDAGLSAAALCAVVAAAEIRSLVATRAVLRTLPDGPVGVVMRRGGLAVAEALPLLGVPLLGVLPPMGRADPSRRAARQVALGLVDGVLEAS